MDRWPRTRDWVNRTVAVLALERVTAAPDRISRVRANEQNDVYRELGFALTAATLGADTPRRGQ